MAMKRLVRTEYRLACDGCGGAGLASATEIGALSVAMAEGWQRWAGYVECVFTNQVLCPACAKERYYEQNAPETGA